MSKSKSSPKAPKPVNQRGFPLLRQSKIPGYNKGTGTPSWVSKPADAAERKAK